MKARHSIPVLAQCSRSQWWIGACVLRTCSLDLLPPRCRHCRTTAVCCVTMPQSAPSDGGCLWLMGCFSWCWEDRGGEGADLLQLTRVPVTNLNISVVKEREATQEGSFVSL